MTIPLYHVDAFSSEHFKGNPAAVCLLTAPLNDSVMQAMAEEHHLSETAFVWQEDKDYHIRWFTPKGEVALCGHATLAAAHVLFNETKQEKEQFVFQSKSGPLPCIKTPQGIEIQLPLITVEDNTVIAPELIKGLGFVPKGIYRSDQDHLIELDNVSQLIRLKPDLSAWQQLDLRGVIVTAQGLDCDFVSRCFYPKYNVDEDPVTGSAHSMLAPFWATRLNKNELKARQLSPRGGELLCRVEAPKVILLGDAITYMIGSVRLTATV